MGFLVKTIKIQKQKKNSFKNGRQAKNKYINIFLKLFDSRSFSRPVRRVRPINERHYRMVFFFFFG